MSAESVERMIARLEKRCAERAAEIQAAATVLGRLESEQARDIAAIRAARQLLAGGGS